MWHENMPNLARRSIRYFVPCIVLLLGACNSVPPVPVVNKPVYDESVPGPNPVFSYYQTLSGMTGAQLGRERMVLAALPNNPNTQLRMAMLYGHPRGPQDLGKAIGLLDAVLKSSDPAAITLHPTAKVMFDNFVERQKLEGQIDRQGQQIKENQRKILELQDKLEGLAEIERTLPSRTQRARPARSDGQR